MSIARNTLERARFFLMKAEVAGPADRHEMPAYLEAAIVFGRSVTFHLQKEFSACPGFKEWYEEQQAAMRADAICRFLLESRNLILKQGPLPLPRTIVAVINEKVEVSDHFEVSIIRAKPWYRRPPQILWADLKASLFRPLRTWTRHRTRRSRKATRSGVSGVVSYTVRFDDADLGSRSAFETLHEYLDTLQHVVEEAERQFA